MPEDHTKDTKKSKAGYHDGAARPDQANSDYCGIPLEEWKSALQKDVTRRFGGIPEDLDQVGKPGW